MASVDLVADAMRFDRSASEARARLTQTRYLSPIRIRRTAQATPIRGGAGQQHSALDQLLRVGALLGASLPGFFLAYVLIVVFATTLHLVPVAGRTDWTSMILPVLTLAAGPTAILSRLVRASLLEVLGEDFIRTARAYGAAERAVVLRHALPNGLIPIVTVIGIVLAHLLAGAVIVETIFAWPGVGKLAVDAIYQRDYTMIQGIVLFVGTIFVVANLLVDLSYAVIDPRVRLARRAA